MSTVLWVKLGSKGSSRVPCEKKGKVHGQEALVNAGSAMQEGKKKVQKASLPQICEPPEDDSWKKLVGFASAGRGMWVAIRDLYRVPLEGVATVAIIELLLSG